MRKQQTSPRRTHRICPNPRNLINAMPYNTEILEMARIACEQIDNLRYEMDISDAHFIEIRDYIKLETDALDSEIGIEAEDIKGLKQEVAAIAALQAVVDGTPDEVIDTHMQNILDRCYAAIKEIEAKE